MFTDSRLVPFFAVLCAVLWGSAYPAIKLGYEYFMIDAGAAYDKLLFAGYRFFLAGIILLAVQKFAGKSIMPERKKDFIKFFCLGLVHTFLQYVLLYLGMTNTTGVKSSIVGSSSVFMSIVIAHFLYSNDRLNWRKMVGCLSGVLAVLLLNLDSGFTLQALKFNWAGDGLILLSTLMGCLGCIGNKELSRENNVFTITGWQLILGSIMLLTVGMLNGGALIFYSFKCYLLLIYMALLSSVALLVWSALYKYNKVGKIAVYSFLTPVFGVILSAVWLGESLNDPKLLVALLITSWGIYFVNK